MDREAKSTLQRSGSVAHLIIENPARRNAITEKMRDDMYLALDAVVLDESVRVLVLKGAGTDFSSGADLTEFGRSIDFSLARTARAMRSIYRKVLSLPKPTIAAVSGAAIGGGLELALACDIRIAEASSIFGLPEVRRGFIPGGGGTQLLRQRTLPSGRSDHVLTGEIVGADQAFRLGWIHEIFQNRKELDCRVVELVNRITTENECHIEEVLKTTRSAGVGSALSWPFRLGGSTV